MAKSKTVKTLKSTKRAGAAKTRKASKTAKKSAKRVAAMPKPRALTPYLAVSDAAGAIAWYKKVFGAKQVGDVMSGPGGKVLHAQLRIADSDLFLSDIFPDSEMRDPSRVGPSINLHYYRPNAGHVWERAVENGAKVIMPFSDMFWGDTYGKILDPFGHSWAIARKSKLNKAQLEKLRQQMMAQMGAGPS